MRSSVEPTHCRLLPREVSEEHDCHPDTQDTQTSTGVGRIARVTGPVVDVEFPPDAMPAIYNALSVDVSFSSGEGESETHTLTLEVEQHLGDNMIRAVSLQPTDGLVRGAEVTGLRLRRSRCRSAT